MAAGELIKSPANPVIVSTDPFEGLAVGAPCVILDAGLYKMWYSGVDASGFPAIGYAESVDGLSWSKWGLPVLEKGIPSAWDSDGAGGACVIVDGATYKMWYTGIKSLAPAIGYAESPDGVNWTKIGAAAVMTKGGAADWDSDGVAFPSVIKDGATYKMWFTGRKATGGLIGTLAIGYANSPDGTTWSKDGSNPVLEKSLAGWDDRGVGACAVKKTGIVYRMYYTGFDASGSVISRIGYITSADEITWTNAATPALDAGGAGSWDERGVAAPTFVLKTGQTELWYTGANTQINQDGFLKIGQAHTEYAPGVPAGSTLSMLILIGGFAVLIGGALVLRRNRG